MDGRQTDRQAGGQAGRQEDRQVGRQKDRQAGRILPLKQKGVCDFFLLLFNLMS